MEDNMGSYAADFDCQPNKRFKFEKPKQSPVEEVSVPKKAVDVTKYQNDQEVKQIDEQSLMGRFGWPEVTTDVYYGIPYILRNSTKYFAVQMILEHELKVYFAYLRPIVYQYCFTIAKNATQAECRLLNEINHIHCNRKFGKEMFTTQSLLLITDIDAYALNEFLGTCYQQLTVCTKQMSDKIGFIEFSGSSIFAPFVSVNGERYMPLNCFANTNNLEVEYISGWDLAYLRFCCLYQGIWRKSSDFLAVVSLSSIRANLPNDTQFVTCWPTSLDHQLIRTSTKKPSGRKRNLIKLQKQQIQQVRRANNFFVF